MAEEHPYLQVNDENFQNEVLESELPTVVDFWASWCGPCQVIAPIFEELANQYQGKVKFAKVDVDQSQQTAANLGIRSIPTIILFQGGKVVDQVVGSVPKPLLETLIKKGIS